MEVKTAERQFAIGGHPVTSFEVSKSGGLVTYNADPYKVMMTPYGGAFIARIKDPAWVANYFLGSFKFAAEGMKEPLADFHVIDSKPYLVARQFVDVDLFKKAGGRTEMAGCLSLKEVEEVLKLHEGGQLKLAGDTEDAQKANAEKLRNVLRYQNGIREVASLAYDVEGLKSHPAFDKIVELDFSDRKSAVDDAEAQTLAAIDSISKVGGKATSSSIFEFIGRGREVKLGDTQKTAGIIEIDMVLRVLENKGCATHTQDYGWNLTDKGNAELQNFRKKLDYMG